MTGRFSGRVALITGAGSGLGRGTAIGFAGEGARVVAVDINQSSAQETATLIAAQGGDAIAVQADVSRPEDCERMVSTAVQTYGRLDIQFNNAGIGGDGQLLKDLPVEDWDRLIAVNLRGVFLGCKYAVPAMIAAGGGAIINTGSSLAQWDVIPGAVAYIAAKGGVIGITRALAIEVAGHGIRVNAVCPGIVDTPMSFSPDNELRRHQNALYDRFVQRIPLHRIGTPEDVAEAVMFFASDAAKHITGTTLLVDGGQTMMSWSNGQD